MTTYGKRADSVSFGGGFFFSFLFYFDFSERGKMRQMAGQNRALKPVESNCTLKTVRGDAHVRLCLWNFSFSSRRSFIQPFSEFLRKSIS